MSLSLSIPLTARAVEIMKAHLTRAIPHVKSSHRCEVLARGLGSSTYAAVLQVSAQEPSTHVTTDGDAFASYLSSRGFHVSSAHLLRAVGLVALHNVSLEHPRVTVWGIGIGEFQREQDGRWETVQAWNRRFVEARKGLATDSSIAPFLLSLALLQRVPATSTIRSGTGSYKLKHIAENYACSYPDGETLGPRYVPNGLLIAAAITAGFRYKTHIGENGFEQVNVIFNMSKRAIDDLDCEIRPDGALAQSRRRRTEINFAPGITLARSLAPRRGERSW